MRSKKKYVHRKLNELIKQLTDEHTGDEDVEYFEIQIKKPHSTHTTMSTKIGE